MGKSNDTAPNTDQKDSLYANFSNTSQTGTVSCPMKGNIAIFPVRYAVDELLEAYCQEDNPLKDDPKAIQCHIPYSVNGYPGAHNYFITKRQIRDGWLYVWDEAHETLHEYSIQGCQFTRHIWRPGIETEQDIRNNPSVSKHYIEYPRSSKLYLFYSPLQWTQRICDLVRQKSKKVSKWATIVDLPSYYKGSENKQTNLSTHGFNNTQKNALSIYNKLQVEPLTKLGESVADIKPANPPISQLDLRPNGEGDFLSTTVATIKNDDGLPYKEVIHENKILGACPDKDSAVMVTLHDPLGLLDDLLMRLKGVWLEQSSFEEKNQHKTETASQCLQLLNVDVVMRMIPKGALHIRNNQAQLYLCLRDLYKYIDIRAGRHSPFDKKYPEKLKELEDKWKCQFDARIDNEVLAGIEKHYEQVRADEMLNHLATCVIKQQRLKEKIISYESDLMGLLDVLDTSAEDVCVDTIANDQSTYLLERATMVYKQFGSSETGKAWIAKQHNSPSSLIGLGLFNFSKELSGGMTNIAKQFCSVDGVVSLASSIGMGHTANGVLDLATICQSDVYRNLSQPTKQTFDTLTRLVTEENTIAKNAWEHIAYHTLPALNPKQVSQERILAHSIMTLVSANETSSVRIVKNLNYETEMKEWARWITIQNRLMKRLLGQTKPHMPGGQAYGTASDIDSIQKELEEHAKNKPTKPQKNTEITTKTTHTTGAAHKRKIILDEYEGELKKLIEEDSICRDLRNQIKGQTKSQIPTNMRRGEYDHTKDLERKLAKRIKFLGQRLAKDKLEPIFPSQLICKKVEGHQTIQVQDEAEILESKNAKQGSNYNKKINAGNILSIGMIAINFWNFVNTLGRLNDKMIYQELEGSDKREVLSSAAYTANSIVAFWIMPVWKRLASMPVKVGEAEKQLAQISIRSLKNIEKNNLAALTARLTVNAAAMTGISAIASGLEAWNTWEETNTPSKTSSERTLLYIKFGTLAMMTGVAVLQTVGLLAARWVACSWVFGPVVSAVLLVLGLIYLTVTLLIEYFSLSNLQRWLNFSYWGKGENPSRYKDTQEDFIKQSNMLYRILMEPSVLVSIYPSKTLAFPNGYWLGIRFPAAMAGLEVEIKSGLQGDNLHDGWVETKKEWKFSPGITSNLSDKTNIEYTEDDSYRTWQTWVKAPKYKGFQNLEIIYPQNENGFEAHYFFNIEAAENKILEQKINYFDQATFKSSKSGSIILTIPE